MTFSDGILVPGFRSIFLNFVDSVPLNPLGLSDYRCASALKCLRYFQTNMFRATLLTEDISAYLTL